jgi:protein SCO1/2
VPANDGSFPVKVSIMAKFSLRSLAWPSLIATVVVIAMFGIASTRHTELPLHQYGLVPSFSLTERSGQTITNSDLEGKIWVADFIFTTCPGPCPIISANMARLQSALGGDNRVQLVSFTVDPQDDTPSALSAYANHLGADPQRWWFLTGPEKTLYDLIRNGFYQSVQDNHGKPLDPGQFVVTHSTYMALVDSHGIMRGFYSGLSEEDQKSLLAAIRQLENE